MKVEAHPKAHTCLHRSTDLERKKEEENGNERTKAKGTVIVRLHLSKCTEQN